jgi:hypothetical protein
MKTIAIFGSGLSAAYVYYAAKNQSYDCEFFTDKPLDTQPDLGHVLLRWVPPTVEAKPYPIWFFSLGSIFKYLERMQRPETDLKRTAFPKNGRTELQAFNPNFVLKEMLPEEAKVTYGKFSDEEIALLAKKYDWSFVTFPLQQSKHQDRLAFYWSYVLHDQSLMLPNMAIYNATDQFPWTRFTQYWNTLTWEFSHIEYPAGKEDSLPPRPNSWAEPKRIADVAPNLPEFYSPYEKVSLVGRWARWNKSVLAHDAYMQASTILKEINND